MRRRAPAHQDRRDNAEADREDGDSSYRLPLATPCSGGPLHHHSVALHTRTREVEVSGGGTALLPSLLLPPAPRDSPCLLWAPGPQGLPERKGRW